MAKCTLYKYISSNYLLDIVESGLLRMSDVDNFNDPFDMRIINSLTNDERIIRGVQVLCLTNSYSNKLLWSHYSESHKGVCLTIEIPVTDVYPICYTGQRVTEEKNIDRVLSSGKYYSKKNIVLDFTRMSTDMKRSIVKGKCWSYEKEYRVVLEEGNSALMRKDTDSFFYYPVKIKNIYLGIRFDENESEEKKNKLYDLCREKGITITEMKKSNNNYGISVGERVLL